MDDNNKNPSMDNPLDKKQEARADCRKAADEAQQPAACPYERRLPASFASEEVRSRARSLFEQGYGYKSVARVIGLSIHTVRDWGRQFKQGRFNERFSDSLARYERAAHDHVWRCHKQGLSLREIALETGISISTCWSWIQKRRELENA